MHGKGVFTWPDGRVYDGNYENGKKSGFGTYVWSEKKKYTGYWKDGRQHGKGAMVTDTEVKKGEWKDGNFETNIFDRYNSL